MPQPPHEEAIIREIAVMLASFKARFPLRSALGQSHRKRGQNYFMEELLVGPSLVRGK